MAVLRRRTLRRRTLRVGTALLALALVGACAVLEALRGPRPLAFSHRLHVEQEQLDCVICHETAFTRDEPGTPAFDTCSLCHEVLDAEKPEERRVETLFEDGVYLAARHSALPEEVVFSHELHAAGELACAECHKNIERNQRLTHAIGVDMGRCIACHDEWGTPDECSTCHTSVDQRWMPPSHLRNWTRAHGPASRELRGIASQDCSLCHGERTCLDCHLATPPAGHTDVFRRKTHGIHAALDRRTCAACHRSDSCNRCHLETRPRSHVAQWGGQRSRHCLGCHFPTRANGCIVCHKGTPSHLLAAPKPAWHNPAMNCRQCHGITAPLPHVDKGDDCNACHL